MSTATSFAPQGSQEWKELRLGHVTASRFGDVIKYPRSKNGSGLSQTAESYLMELVGEHLTGKPESDLETYAMKWGNDNEPHARKAYIWRTGEMVREVGFEFHHDEELIGCSLDGTIGIEGQIEIKCPLKCSHHVEVLVSGQIPKEHMPQVQGGLWISGRKWSNFISYHPNCKTPETKLAVVRVYRDEAYIDELAKKVIRFRDRLLETLELLKSRASQ